MPGVGGVGGGKRELCARPPACLPAAERAPGRREVARAASLAGSSRGGDGQPEGESDWQLGRGRAEPSPGSCCYGGRAVRADGTRKGRGSSAVRGSGAAGARSIGAPPEEAPAALGGGRSRAPAAPRALVSPDGSRR